MLRLQPICPETWLRLAALLAMGAATPCLASEPAAEQVGAAYELRLTYDTKSVATDGSSSSSNGSDALIERVVEVTPEGMVLEYDLPSEPPHPHGRQDQWQLPARVLKPLEGPMRLLNRAELEARIEQWLEHTETPRSACGAWYFTWNAFRVECDPQSVIGTLERFDLRPGDLREGVPFHEPGASEPAQVTEKSAGPEGATYVVELAVDPDWVHREEAESDVVVGEIMGEPVTFDEAVRARSAEEISGTITLTFDTDADGSVRRRTKVTRLEIRKPDGAVETSTAAETLDRRLLPPVD